MSLDEAGINLCCNCETQEQVRQNNRNNSSSKEYLVFKDSTFRRHCFGERVFGVQTSSLPMTSQRQYIGAMPTTVLTVFILVFVSCFSCAFSATIRNPLDLDHIVDLDHQYLTYGNHHSHSDVINEQQYHFRSDVTHEFSPLRHNPSIDLSSPLCYVHNGEMVCEYNTDPKMKFYKNADNTVAVSVTNENGTMKLKGYVNDGQMVSEIDPLLAEGAPSNRYHVIKKRWTANIIHHRPRRASSRSKPKKKSRRNSRKKSKKSRSKSKSKKGSKSHKKVNSYTPYPSRTKSPYKDIPDVTSASDYCIDVLCVVDYSIYKKYYKSEGSSKKAMEKIRYYYAHIINGINMRFGSINDKDLHINVRLAGYFVAKSPSDLRFIDSVRMETDAAYRVNSNHTLTELDAYLKHSRGLPDYNHAMLFLEYAATNLGGTVLEGSDHHIDESTYKYAFKHGETKDGISGDDGGTSFVGGLCSHSKSTSLVVDHGSYTAAGIGCHELGHNLGVYYHDGEGTARSSSCNASRNYIMAPASYLIDQSNLKYSFSFSHCSLQQIKKHLNTLIKMNRNCMQCSARVRSSRADQEVDTEVQTHLRTLPGTQENVHAQCKQLYGEGSFMCPPKSPEEMCYRMYCYDPDRSACAIISEQMAATGTPCGKYKVCSMGQCVQDRSNGKDVPDDCPYPDIPSYGAHCEDATPFMCENDKFRQKCCESCNKKFTAEEMCKDSHVEINAMSCSQLMDSVYGLPGCQSDTMVKNMCCRSCKNKLAEVPERRGTFLFRGGSRFMPQGYSNSAPPRSSGYPRSRGDFNSGRKGSPSYSGGSRSSKSRSRGTVTVITSRVVTRRPPPPSCEDSVSVTFNNKPCPVLVQTDKRFCGNCKVQSVCCKSCYRYRDEFNKC